MNRKLYSRLTVLVVCLLALAVGASAQEPLKIGEDQARGALVNKTPPSYPNMAKQMRITGKVLVEAMIDTEGKVENCEPVSGNPLLTGAAVAAVKKWTFKPFTAGDKPAKAVTRLTFEFAL
jgi:TonB family protein